MDLNEVAVFLKVVQTGSFSKAAKMLGMPNSTVSSKVSSLEKRLGVTLIQRTTRKLNITPAGNSYYKRCLIGLEEIASAETELLSLKGEPQGLLRITAPNELGSSVLPSLVSDFLKKYPKTSIETLMTDRTIDLLSEGVDLAIRAGNLKDSSLIAKKIGSVYFAPFASPKYIKVNGTPSHPRDLRQHKTLQFSPISHGGEWRLTGPKGTLDIPVVSSVSTNDISMLKAMTVMGDGIALLPTYYCIPEVKAGKLIRLLPEWKTNLSPVHFVYPAQRFVTPKLSAFMSHALDCLKKSLEDFEI